MGIVDAQTLLWDAAALSADAVSTNAYDMALATRDISNGEPLCAVITVDVAADDTTGDETYRFDVITSAAAALTSPTIIASRIFGQTEINAGALAQGEQIVIDIPPQSINQRYLGLQFDGGGTSPTITVTAWITPRNLIRTNNKYHPKGYTVTLS